MYCFAEFTFIPDTACLNTASEQVRLRNKVALLLAYFLQHPNEVISKERLLSELWQHGDFREASLTQSIRELRAALGDDAKTPRFIETIPQRGYRWICPLKLTSKSHHSKSANASKQNIFASTKKLIFMGLCGLVAMSIWSTTRYFEDDVTADEADSQQHIQQQVESLIVLPFSNNTGNADMAWLELGLSDMLSVDLKRANQVQIVSPAQGNLLLLEHQISWPTLPNYIRAMLEKEQIDAALVASVRLLKQQQIIDFQILFRDGRVQQGSMSFDNLAANIDRVGHQVFQLINPKQVLTSEHSQPDLSAMAIAQGMQALQTTGALDAKRFFSASLTLKPSLWAKAYLSQTLITLGQWQEAEQTLFHLVNISLEHDPYLDAFVHFLMADLMSKKGHPESNVWIAKSVTKSAQTQDAKLLASSLKLEADQHFLNMNWQAHEAVLDQIDQTFELSTAPELLADKMFYLGEPINSGLEQSPHLDLAENAKRLKKALGFYQTLNNRSQVAATQLAIAQNYGLPVEERAQALIASMQAYRVLQQPYELAVAEMYAGFYQMQLHQGDKAQVYFQSAIDKAQQLDAKNLLDWAQFYLAFAYLDQGLDQSDRGGQAGNPQKLKQAIDLLNQVLNTTSNQIIAASSRVFLGWAHTQTQDFELAHQLLAQALLDTETPAYRITHAYARYSKMYAYLLQQQYAQVLNLRLAQFTTRLEAIYVARAYAELDQFDNAITTLKTFQSQLPTQWQQADTQLLAEYQNANKGGQWLRQALEKAHSVYCETEWLVE